MKSKRTPWATLVAVGLCLSTVSLTACESSSDGGSSSTSNSTTSDNSSDGGGGGGGGGGTSRAFTTDVLLFAGSGTWSSEVASIKSILTSHGTTYKAVTSAQLEVMTVDQIAQYGAMVFPGGAGGTEAGSLTASAHARIREAVQVRGVGYTGFCAGSFIAAAPAPAAGKDVSYGLGVVDGPILDYYYLENQGTDIAMTLQTFADGTTADILWYGGPMTPDEGVIAKYPDGTPSISEMWSGNGFVVLSGGHPTATSAMLSSLGMSSSDGIHTEIAWKLINAAVHQVPLPTF